MLARNKEVIRSTRSRDVGKQQVIRAVLNNLINNSRGRLTCAHTSIITHRSNVLFKTRRQLRRRRLVTRGLQRFTNNSGNPLSSPWGRDLLLFTRRNSRLPLLRRRNVTVIHISIGVRYAFIIYTSRRPTRRTQLKTISLCLRTITINGTRNDYLYKDRISITINSRRTLQRDRDTVKTTRNRTQHTLYVPTKARQHFSTSITTINLHRLSLDNATLQTGSTSVLRFTLKTSSIRAFLTNGLTKLTRHLFKNRLMTVTRRLIRVVTNGISIPRQSTCQRLATTLLRLYLRNLHSRRRRLFLASIVMGRNATLLSCTTSTRNSTRLERTLKRTYIQTKGSRYTSRFTGTKDDNLTYLGDDLRDTGITLRRRNGGTYTSLLLARRESVYTLRRNVNYLSKDNRTINLSRTRDNVRQRLLTYKRTKLTNDKTLNERSTNRVYIEAYGSISTRRLARTKDDLFTDLNDDLSDTRLTNGSRNNRANASNIKAGRLGIDDLRRYVNDISITGRALHLSGARDFRGLFLLSRR